LELKIREDPSSKLRNIDSGGGPSGGEDVDGGPLGVLTAGSTVTTTEVEDVDGGPLGGASGKSGSGHHRS
jgi:hypothetical protein